MERSETYNHSKDVHPRRDASKQCLNKMHGPKNAHTTVFFKLFDNTRSQLPSLLHANAPPPREKNHGPPCQWPPFRERRILARASGKWGGW